MLSLNLFSYKIEATRQGRRGKEEKAKYKRQVPIRCGNASSACKQLLFISTCTKKRRIRCQTSIVTVEFAFYLFILEYRITFFSFFTMPITPDIC
jgi:hypothetical protein